MTVGAVPEVLERARVAVLPALEQAVSSLCPEVAAVASYHLGWTDAHGRPTAARSGKHLRPALALLSAEAAGADCRAGIPAAVAVELVHNFSLLHDDIIDADVERRRRATAWTVFGQGAAIIGGDALLVLALRTVLDAGPGGTRAAQLLVEATMEMIAGQASDMAFEARDDVSVEECAQMASQKSGALLACAAAVGAAVAGSDAVVGHLAAFGRHLGLAFQAVDDLLGIWGDPAVTGKPVASDLRQRKKTLPIAAALAVGGGPGDALRDLLAGGPLDEATLARAAALVEEAGGREATTALARRELAAALARLDDAAAAGAATGALRELSAVARFVGDRDL